MAPDLEVLALGDRFSSAYRSIEEAIATLGKITYRDEKTFEDKEAGINFIRNSSFDIVVMPNPYGNERRREIYDQLRRLEFPVIVFDRGGLPNSWFFDTGFNADSSSYHPLRWDRQLTDEENDSVESYIEAIKNQLPPLEAQGKRLGGSRLREELGVGARKMLFVPLQRPSDTTTKFFCAPLVSLNAFYDLVSDVALRAAGSLDEWVVVAKKHPLEANRPRLPVKFADEAHINDLIEASDAVLVLNSGAGLLSMCWKKPVLIAGTAYYSHPRLNRQVRSVDDVEYYLRNLPGIDVETRNRFVHYLRTSVYSFGRFNTELVRQRDGSLRNVTRHIEFDVLRMPELQKKKPCSM